MLRRADTSFTTVLTYDDGQGEDEEGSLPHMGYGGGGSKLPPGILPHGLPQVKEVQPAVTSVEEEQKKQEVKESECCYTVTIKIISLCAFLVKELSEEQKQMIILSEDFQHFMDRAGRLMERAICEAVDIYTDYSGGPGEDGL